MKGLTVAAALLLVACTQTGDDSTDAASEPSATEAAVPVADGASDLPALDPRPPSVREFARVAGDACGVAAAQVAAAPLRGDPFLAGARRGDIVSAEAHYRAAAQAWTAMAERLWEFGLPKSRRAQRLITLLDTMGQYAGQAAEQFAERDLEPAQSSVKSAAHTMRSADRVAAKMGFGPLERCARARVALANARRVVVEATDFEFTVPRLRRGVTRFVLRNDGREEHQLFVVALRRRGTLQEAVAADRHGDAVGKFLARTGATTPVVGPAERASVDVRLRQGPYGLLCFVASPDGTPHAYKGMATEVPVR
ncbi:MAG: hypothetical protein GEU74_08310 [Nitriliruptorales bacterium]|nr:hypothetical protein [Nitriliruptorales bacterium]